MAADPPASSAHARGSLAAGGQDRTGTGHQPHRLSPPPELLQSEGEDRGPAEGGAGSRRALPCQQMRGRGGEQRREVDPPAFRLLLGGCAFPLEGLLESLSMIQITPQMRILLATEPVDFRRGIDGLAVLCRTALHSDPMSGAMFVFRNRRGTAIKILVYDSQGFWLAQKRLS